MERLNTTFFVCLLVVCGTFFTACINDEEEPGEDRVLPGDKLPEFSVRLVDGTLLSSAEQAGKVTVWVFFHTGCPDCQAELPVVQQLYDRYKSDTRTGIYAIGREEAADDVAAYWEANGLTLPYSPQEDRTVYSLFSTRGIPRIYVADTSLHIYSAYSDDPLATLSQLEADVAACLP